MNREDMKRRIARTEERTRCQEMGNDKERIKKMIQYYQIHLEELKDILEKEDFR